MTDTSHTDSTVQPDSSLLQVDREGIKEKYLLEWLDDCSRGKRLDSLKLLLEGVEPASGDPLPGEVTSGYLRSLTEMILQQGLGDPETTSLLLEKPGLGPTIVQHGDQSARQLVLERTIEWLRQEPQKPHPRLENLQPRERIRRLTAGLRHWYEEYPGSTLPERLQKPLRQWCKQDYPDWDENSPDNSLYEQPISSFSARGWRGYRAWADVLDQEPSLDDEFLWQIHTVLMDNDRSMHTELARHPAGTPKLWEAIIEDIDDPEHRAHFLSVGARNEDFLSNPKMRELILEKGNSNGWGRVLPWLDDPEQFREGFQKLAQADLAAAATTIKNTAPRQAIRFLRTSDLIPLLASDDQEWRETAFSVLRQQERPENKPLKSEQDKREQGAGER